MADAGYGGLRNYLFCLMKGINPVMKYNMYAKKNERKYEYQINISMAIHLVMSFIKKKGGAPPNLLELIAKEILPIRPGRSFERKVKGNSFVSFGYRFN